MNFLASHRHRPSCSGTVARRCGDSPPIAAIPRWSLALGWVAFLVLASTSFGAGQGESSRSSAAAAWPELRSGVEIGYLNLLISWASGSETAVRELSDFQQAWASREAGFVISVDTFRLLPVKTSQAGFSGPKPTREIPLALSKRLPGNRCLRKLEQRIQRQVTDLDPEGLLALAYLHRQLYLHQMVNVFRPWLAEHSRLRAFWLTDFHREKTTPTAPWNRDSLALSTAMADAVFSSSFFDTGTEAREVYLQILELDAEHAVARYQVAFLEEMLGRYGKAIHHLQTLTDLDPGDTEVALRLAVNQARSGQRSAAESLASIARGQGPDWIRILAYQELGRLHGEDEPELAVAHLRAAVQDFPANQRLRLQLAYLLDPDWRASAVEVQGVEASWDGDVGMTPRLQYCVPRRDALDRELERLRQEVERRQPILQRALERLLERRPRIDECALDTAP